MRLYSLYLLIPAIQAYRPILHDKVVSTVYNSIDEGDDMNAVPTIVVNIEENEKRIQPKTPMTNIMTKFIVGYSIRKKIFDEVANDGDMIKTFDSFNPLYLLVLFVSSVFSLNDMRHSKKIPVLQTKTSNPIYRWVDALLLIIVITLMKNVKNAI